MRKTTAVAIAASIAALPAGPGRAMDFSLVNAEKGQIIVAKGEIVTKDDEKLHGFVAGLPPDTKLLAVVVTSPGGNLVEGVRLAETIRSTGLETGVLDQCASACFLMFAAGRHKFVINDAEVGVHSASMPGGRETTESQAITTLMARTANEFGVPAGIIGKMVTTPPNNMTWLTPDDLRSMNVEKVYTQSAAYRPGSPLRPGSAPPPAQQADVAPTPAQVPPAQASPARPPGRVVGHIRSD